MVPGTGDLVAGLLMTGWSFAGRWIVLLFHPAGSDEPPTLKPDSRVVLNRRMEVLCTLKHTDSLRRRQSFSRMALARIVHRGTTSFVGLGGRFQLIVWDMPGLGHSQTPRDGDYSLERHAPTWRR